MKIMINIKNQHCYIKTGYPCCSPETTEVYETDESGNWSYENDHWCLIKETISTPTPIYTPTTTTTTKRLPLLVMKVFQF